MAKIGDKGVRIQREYRCSFCDKNQDMVKRLIAGPRGVFICNECIALCQEIINEEETLIARTEGQQETESGTWVHKGKVGRRKQD